MDRCRHNIDAGFDDPNIIDAAGRTAQLATSSRRSDATAAGGSRDTNIIDANIIDAGFDDPNIIAAGGSRDTNIIDANIIAAGARTAQLATTSRRSDATAASHPDRISRANTSDANGSRDANDPDEDSK